MTEKGPRQGISHAQKAMVATGETAFFALMGSFWPPANIGWVVTGAVTLWESNQAMRETAGQLSHIRLDVEHIVEKVEKKVKEIEKKVKEVEQRVTESDDEPIPPNPETATPEEIENYKRIIHEQAFKNPKG